MNTTRRLLAALALPVSIALLAGAGRQAQASSGNLFNGSFENGFDHWLTETGSEHGSTVGGPTDATGTIELVQLNDGPDGHVARLSVHALAAGSHDFPHPCAGGGARVDEDIFSVAFAGAEIFQPVMGVRSTTLRMEVSAEQQLLHVGGVVTSSKLTVEVFSVDNPFEPFVFEVLPTLQPDEIVFCTPAKVTEARTHAVVDLDLSQAGIRVGDRVGVRVIATLSLTALGFEGGAEASAQITIDDMSFVEPQ